MHFVNATNLNRKSGVAEWRDLQFCGFSPHKSPCTLYIRPLIAVFSQPD
jgi:hypothetical protein